MATSTADVERRRAEAQRSFREAGVAVEMNQHETNTPRNRQNGEACHARWSQVAVSMPEEREARNRGIAGIAQLGKLRLRN